MKPTTRARAIVAAAVAAALAAPALAPLPATARRTRVTAKPTVKIIKIAPGLTLTKIVEKQTPRRTFILTADLSTALTLDLTPAGNQLPARAKTGEMAKRAEALAAVNGDFTDPSIGRPIHPFAFDGQLLQTARQIGAMFAVSRDEQHVYAGRPAVAVTVTDTSAQRIFTLSGWNDGPPAPGEIAGFSPLGGTLEQPPEHACSVRLLPAGAPTPSAQADGVDQDFTVDAAACAEDPMPPSGGVVLSAPPSTDEATQLLALASGTTMRLHWTLGWPDVFDAVGGMPLLLSDGRIAVSPDCHTSLCRPNPRTGIGVTADGKILLVVVDGRQPKWSVGPTLFGFARIMQDHGAVWALNLDGGGSTTMVVEGEVVNRPSEGYQRSISNAVLVLPGPDPGEQ
jgi:large repetitive protein